MARHDGTPSDHPTRSRNAQRRQLLEDDVGIGKTIEAGLIAQELVLRNQVQKILIACPPGLCGKWQRECVRSSDSSSQWSIPNT